MLTKQQLTYAARYGTDMLYHTNMTDDDIKTELTDFLSGKDEKGRKLDPRRLSFEINRDEFPIIDDAKSFDKMFDLLKIFYEPRDHISYVKVSYTFKAPMLFYSWGNYIPNTTAPRGNIVISSTSHILLGTGAKKNI